MRPNHLLLIKSALTRVQAAGCDFALTLANVLEWTALELRRRQKLATLAKEAERADVEAAHLLRKAARDGLSQADMPALSEACRLIKRSAALDHAIARQSS